MIFAAEDLGDLLDLAVLLSLPGVLVLAWLVGRLLGVRRSWTTTLLSGFCSVVLIMRVIVSVLHDGVN